MTLFITENSLDGIMYYSQYRIIERAEICSSEQRHQLQSFKPLNRKSSLAEILSSLE